MLLGLVGLFVCKFGRNCVFQMSTHNCWVGQWVEAQTNQHTQYPPLYFIILIGNCLQFWKIILVKLFLFIFYLFILTPYILTRIGA